jgi:hypothetical protein
MAAMSGRTKWKHRTKVSRRFVMITHDVLYSRAWADLSCTDRSVLLALWARHNGGNNGAISFGCREAGDMLRVGKDTAMRCLRSLYEHGFIRPTRLGYFKVKTERLATTWRLTMLPTSKGEATHDYKGWMGGLVDTTTWATKNQKTVRSQGQMGQICPCDATEAIGETAKRSDPRDRSPVLGTSSVPEMRHIYKPGILGGQATGSNGAIIDLRAEKRARSKPT